MTVRIADPVAAPSTPEADLLARLGLKPGASNDQIEAAHDAVLEYLASAPSGLRDWARTQILEVDEAYGLLNGVTLPPDRPSGERAGSARAAEPRHGDGDGATKAKARANRSERDPDKLGDASEGDLFGGGGTWIGQSGGATVVSRRERRAASAPARPIARGLTGAPGTVTLDVSTVRKAGIGLGLLAAAAVAVFVIFQVGGSPVPGINGSPAPQASGGLDTAAVAADMQKLATNQNDVATLQDLANLYYAADEYATAQTWLDKVLALDPKNVAALLGYGAVAFNLGDYTTAAAKWRAVVAIDPKNIEAHYDLGFMYFSQTPPDIAGVRSEWSQVLALGPSDDLKTYIQAHLASLDSVSSGAPGPSGAVSSPAPSGSAAPIGSPGASPAPSPAAS